MIRSGTSKTVVSLPYKVMIRSQTYDWTINLRKENLWVIRLHTCAMERSLRELLQLILFVSKGELFSLSMFYVSFTFLASIDLPHKKGQVISYCINFS